MDFYGDILFEWPLMCLSIFQQNKVHADNINGGLTVYFDRFNPQSSYVHIYVSSAYALVARDFPSGLSDPYYQLAIVPRMYNQPIKKSDVVASECKISKSYVVH